MPYPIALKFGKQKGEYKGASRYQLWLEYDTTGDFVHENPMKKYVHPVKSEVFIGWPQ